MATDSGDTKRNSFILVLDVDPFCREMTIRN